MNHRHNVEKLKKALETIEKNKKKKKSNDEKSFDAIETTS